MTEKTKTNIGLAMGAISLYLTLTTSRPIDWLFENSILAQTDENKIYFPFFKEYGWTLSLSLIGVFFLLTTIFAYRFFSDRDRPYKWEGFFMNSMAFASPFLLLASIIMQFTKPVTSINFGASLFYAVLVSFVLFFLVRWAFHILSMKERLLNE